MNSAGDRELMITDRDRDRQRERKHGPERCVRDKSTHKKYMNSLSLEMDQTLFWYGGVCELSLLVDLLETYRVDDEVNVTR